MSDGPEHEAFRESLRAFIERDVRPMAGPVPSGTVPEKVFAVAGENGFLGTSAPEEHGGAGTGDLRFALAAAEELTAAGLPGLAVSFAAHAAVAVPLLTEAGLPGQRERWLPGLAEGSVLATVARGTATISGPGASGSGWILDGSASAVVSAARAGLFLVPARTDDGRGRVVLVDAAAPGVTVTLAAGALGLPGVGTAGLGIRSVPVCDDDILPEAAGQDTDARLLADERLAVAVIAVAGTRAVLEQTLGYVRDRVIFGRPVASFENTEYALGGLAADLTVTGTCTQAFVRRRLTGPLDPGLAAAVSLRATDLFAAAADQCLQLHGGYGYMREYPVSQAYADSRYLRLLAGQGAMVRTLAAGLGLTATER